MLLTEILLKPRIARQGAVGLISMRGQARKTRIEKFELDEGFQPYLSPALAHSVCNISRNRRTIAAATVTTSAKTKLTKRCLARPKFTKPTVANYTGSGDRPLVALARNYNEIRSYHATHHIAL